MNKKERLIQLKEDEKWFDGQYQILSDKLDEMMKLKRYGTEYDNLIGLSRIYLKKIVECMAEKYSIRRNDWSGTREHY